MPNSKTPPENPPITDASDSPTENPFAAGPARNCGPSPKFARKIKPTDDLFATTKKMSSIPGGKERWRHDVELLQFEWAVKYPLYSIMSFLEEIKGYSTVQAHGILKMHPAPEWKKAHAEILDKLTESTVKRHIDLIAEVQETHIKASKLGLAKAIEMLTRMSLSPIKDKKGKILLGEDGKPVYRGARSIDLLNCMGAIEKAQQIYRRAMGLPNEEAGLAQILDKINEVRDQSATTFVQNNVQVNVAPPVDELGQKLAELKYSDVMELIERRRELKKIAAAEVAGRDGTAEPNKISTPSEKVH